MIALTQDKREELIDHNSQKLKSLKYNIKEATIPLLRKHLEIEIQSTEIALASLTAEPAAYLNKNDVYSGENHILARNSISHACTLAAYAAPPVPEIKLPSIEQLAEEYKYQVSPHDTVLLRFALNVIKRLNGLGE